jgi:hypothetical protein
MPLEPFELRPTSIARLSPVNTIQDRQSAELSFIRELVRHETQTTHLAARTVLPRVAAARLPKRAYSHFVTADYFKTSIVKEFVST